MGFCGERKNNNTTIIINNKKHVARGWEDNIRGQGRGRERAHASGFAFIESVFSADLYNIRYTLLVILGAMASFINRRSIIK